MHKETSSEVSTIASRVLGSKERVTADASDYNSLLRDARTLAASALSQDEHAGHEAPTFLDRLRSEREELKSRVDKLQSFIASEPAHISAKQLSLLDAQLPAMRTYLHILDMRLDDLETGHVEETSTEQQTEKTDGE